MKITLYTEGVIDSAHYLRGYDGNCKNQHGHSWKLRIWIRGDQSQQDEVGILFDFGNVKKIVSMYDHRMINEISPFDRINPTAENLVYEIYRTLKAMKPLEYKVRIYETSIGKETYAELGDF